MELKEANARITTNVTKTTPKDKTTLFNLNTARRQSKDDFLDLAQYQKLFDKEGIIQQLKRQRQLSKMTSITKDLKLLKEEHKNSQDSMKLLKANLIKYHQRGNQTSYNDPSKWPRLSFEFPETRNIASVSKVDSKGKDLKNMKREQLPFIKLNAE